MSAYMFQACDRTPAHSWPTEQAFDIIYTRIASLGSNKPPMVVGT